MKEYVKSFSISVAFSAIPYVLVAWGITKFTNGDTQAFWVALGVLIGLRLFFSIIEMLGGILYWRLYARRITLDSMLKFLKANDYPPRKDPHDGIISYILRIQNDPEYPEPLRKSTFWIEHELTTSGELGLLGDMRLWKAWDAALDVYAPKAQATRHL